MEKIKGLTVCFEKDIPEYEVENITRMIKLIKGVADVNSIEAEPQDQINRMRFKYELRDKFYDFMSKELSF